jgi:Na+/H+-dicarboxylate symporter
MNHILKSLPFKLLIALIAGILLGTFANETVINVVLSIRHLLGQVIFFAVPLIILGFVAPAIARMGQNASRLLGFSLAISYASTLGIALMAMVSGYIIIPALSIPASVDALRTLPAMIFTFNIPPIMPVMSALALALILGLAVAWNKATNAANLLEEFHLIVLSVVKKVVLPILPFFIGATFATLAYDGRLTMQLPVFLQVILIIIVGHLIWLTLLYGIAAIYSKRNPFEVIKHYGPVYLTGAGTMSSAATLAVALKSASKSKVLNKEMVDFGIPLFAHIHMCGSALSITFLALTVSQVLYGALPPIETMLLFIVLMGIFATAAPGVPGGTLMASLGLITAVLGFDEAGTALMLTIFALQDSFGTACNISSDGAMVMILTRYAEKRGLSTGGGSVDVV